MSKVSHEREMSGQEQSSEQQEHYNKHETPAWARKYLDLADAAFTGGSNEESGQR